MRDALIAVHATAALVAFAAGVWLVVPWGRREAAWAFAVYVGALALMAIALDGAVALDWSHLITATRAVFAALCGLAAVMAYVAARARAVPGAASVDRIGFTLIALFDGFAIIAALDAGAPGWAVAVVAVLGVAIGRRAVGYARSRVVEAAAQPGAPIDPEQETTMTHIDAAVTVAAEPAPAGDHLTDQVPSCPCYRRVSHLAISTRGMVATA